jgi:hypothetical protein
VWLYLACTHSPSSASPTGGWETAGPTWDSRPAAGWDLATAQAHVDQFFAWGIPDPITVRDAFLSDLSGRDSQCPEGVGASTTSFSGCTSQSGWTYTGSSTYVEDGQGGFSLAADIYVQDPAGPLFEGGGEVSYMKERGGLGGKLDGTWGMSGDSGWFGTDPSFALSIYVMESTGSVRMIGGLTMDGTSLNFDNYGYDVDCAGPVGRFSLRDPSGWWYDADFGDSCSGCAPLTWGDESLGQLCAPIAPLQDVSGRLSVP